MSATVARLWELARPRLMVGVVALPAIGWAWAHWERALPLYRPGAMGVLAVAWALLHAGTLWLNAARDRDVGAVLLGAPGPVPEVATVAGYGALGLAVVGAWRASPEAAGWALGCAVLSVLYSHPATAWKGDPWLGPAVNIAGYGLASPAAGYALVGMAPTPRTWAVLTAGAAGVGGCYFVAQAFQADEDRARGDRTLVAVAGPRATIQAARVAFALAFGGIVALSVVGWLPRLCLVGGVGWARLDRHLRASRDLPDAGGIVAATRSGVLGWQAVAWTLVAAGVQYGVDVVEGGPVAGLATVGGRPAADLRWLARLAGG